MTSRRQSMALGYFSTHTINHRRRTSIVLFIMQMLIDIAKFKEIAEATQAIVTTIGIVIGGAWVLRNYVFQREYFPRIDFSVDVNFIGVHKGEWLIEILGLLTNQGKIPHTIRSFRFELRCLSKDDVLVNGDATIRGQVLFSHLIKENSWTPAIEGVDMIIHPEVSLRYNYVYRIPEDADFLLLHGILDYEDTALQHRSDRMFKVPDSSRGVNNPSPTVNLGASPSIENTK